MSFTATLLPSGKVLVAGGSDKTTGDGVTSSARLYDPAMDSWRSEEHTSERQSLMRISYAVFCLKNKSMQKKHPARPYTLTYAPYLMNYAHALLTLITNRT